MELELLEITTPAAGLRFVSWSRSRVLAALERARAAVGAAERELLRRNEPAASDLAVRPGAESLEQVSMILFRWVG